MYIYVILVVPILFYYVTCEITTDLSKEIHMKSTQKNHLKNMSSTAELLLANKSSSPLKQDDHISYRVLKTPTRITKLAKSLSLGFDPYFSKDYFEPFERRPRPVTLVSFRKNRLVQRYVIKNNDNPVRSLEVAELQSPYNNVGHFWDEETKEI